MSARPQQRGQATEDKACAWLQQRGLRLLARNYRCRYGEIDLVMADGRTLVFVEVRYRRCSGYGDAVQSITMRKRRRLIAAAMHYLQRQAQPTPPPARFDVVALTAGAGRTQVEWIQDAFQT